MNRLVDVQSVAVVPFRNSRWYYVVLQGRNAASRWFEIALFQTLSPFSGLGTPTSIDRFTSLALVRTTQAQQPGFHHPLLSWCLLDTAFASRDRGVNLGEWEVNGLFFLTTWINVISLQSWGRWGPWKIMCVVLIGIACGNLSWDHMLSLQSDLVSDHVVASTMWHF